MENKTLALKTFIKNEWFLLLSLLPLLFTAVLLQFITSNWNESVQRTVFYSVFLYDIAIILLFIYRNHRFLFEKGEWLRNSITIVGCGVVLLWTYKHKITFRLDILLLFLCALYGVIYRKYIKPTALTIAFFAFIAIRIVGLFWAQYFDYGVRILFEEESIVFFLLVPIILLGFSVSQRQQLSFIAICFKGFLLLLVANVVFYSFAISAEGTKPFFSFLTLNKGYLSDNEGFSLYEILFWTRFKHPSFLSWIILVIGGLGFFLWKKYRTIITTPEIIAYALLLFGFIFMMQARVNIIAYFVVIAFFVYLSVAHLFSKRLKYGLFVGVGLVAIGAVAYLTTHTAYFSDPIRNQLYAIAFQAIKDGNIWIGNGSGYQRCILDGFVYYVHNDFVATLVDTGIAGLTIFVVWLGVILFSKDVLKQYLLVAFLPIMNTDVLFYVFECTYILMPLMLFVLFAPKYPDLQETYSLPMSA